MAASGTAAPARHAEVREAATVARAGDAFRQFWGDVRPHIKQRSTPLGVCR